MRRAIVVVLDGCGAGFAPDAAGFGDPHEPNTIARTWNAVGGIHAPTLSELGFFTVAGVQDPAPPRSDVAYGRLREISMGKDSVTGHWEMMGIHTAKPAPTYPDGFPIQLIKAFESKIGTQTLGNKPASGTQIIAELGQLHVDTGFPIVYTSADSVFQIACHEQVVAVETLYEWCRIAREMLVDPDDVQRVIARPFVGTQQEGFKRTENRKDFPIPPRTNLVDAIGDVYGIGVVPELFNKRGFREVVRTQNNSEHAQMLWRALDSDARFIFVNFEDFDMLYGHRNDVEGFAKCLETFDGTAAEILRKISSEDLVVFTADHGNDPTDVSTDHTREYVPCCVVNGPLSGRQPDKGGMWHVGKLVADHLGIDWKPEF
ncbi:MAG: phosphopentomutase [Armatimonadetes bacterium]|nr:phosphopentomutase [Armatimonadota bacterium]